MQSREDQRDSSQASALKASIIISCYTAERIEDIRRAVASALGQTYSTAEVIVAVDHNQSLHDTLKAELPHAANVVLNTGARGLSETRNNGIRSSSGDIIAFMDDDAVAAEQWLGHLVEDYDDALVLAVGGRTVPLWPSTRPCWFPEELDWIVGGTHKGMPETTHQVRNLWGGNMSFRRKVFREIGLFRTDLGRSGSSGEGEDTEFCMRMRRLLPEARILYEPGAVMYHKVPRQRATLRYVARRSFDGGFALAKIRRSQRPGSQTSLSTERDYLRYLATSTLPEKIRHLYRPQAAAHLGALATTVVARSAGYVAGYLARSGGVAADEAK